MSIAKIPDVFTQENSPIGPRNPETAVFFPREQSPISRSAVPRAAMRGAFVQTSMLDSSASCVFMRSATRETLQNQNATRFENTTLRFDSLKVPAVTWCVKEV